MQIHLTGEGIAAWFAANVPGKSEASFLVTGGEVCTTHPGVRTLGTLRLGMMYRDVDLFCAEDADISSPVEFAGVQVEYLTFTSEVTGVTRRLQKLKAVSAEGRTVTLTANPAAWFVAIDDEYHAAYLRLTYDPVFRMQYEQLRAEGRKLDAYRMLGIRMSQERP